MGALDSVFASQQAPIKQSGSALDAVFGAPEPAPKPLSPFETVFSGPEYLGAGKLDELLGGGPHDVLDRVEYGDILRKHGVPEWLATSAGFAAATVFDPLNLVPAVPIAKTVGGFVEGAFKVGRAGRVFKAMEEVAAKAYEMPRPFKALTNDIPNLAAARASKELQIGKDVKEAFDAVLGKETRETNPALFEEAKRAARARGGELRQKLPMDLAEGSDPLLLGRVYNKFVDKFGDHAAVKHIDDLVKQVNHGWAWFGRNLADSMRTNEHAWGPLGPKLAADIEYTARLAAAGEGHDEAWLAKRLKGMSRAEDEKLTAMLQQEVAPGSDAEAKLVQEVRAFLNLKSADATESGIRMLVPATHSTGQMELFSDLVGRRAELMGAANKLPSGVTFTQIADDLAAGGEAAKKWERDWKLIPFQHRSNYVYKIRDNKAMLELATPGHQRRKDAIEYLMREYGDAFGSPKTASEYLDSILAHHGDPFEIRGGPLQHSREGLLDELNVPYEKRASVWLRKYIHTANKRLSQATTFGARDQKWFEVYRPSIVEAHGDKKQADEVWRAFTGRPDFSQSVGMEIAQKIRTLQTFRLGPRVGLLQLAQQANINATYGNKAAGAAIGMVVRNPKLQDAARVVGALLPSQHFAYDATPLDSMSAWWIKHVTGMPLLDRMNRVTASLAGGYRLNQIAEALPLASGGKRRILERQLYDLGVDVGELASREYKPTVSMMQTAMERASKITQFTTDTMDLPAMAKHNAFTRIMFTFRGFSKQQSTFVNRIVREARLGNWGPVLTYASYFPGMFNAVEPLLQLSQGKDLEPAREQGLMEYVKTLMFTGWLGSMGDALVSGGDAGKLLKGQAGPAVSQGLDIGTGIGAAITGDPSALQRTLLRSLPGGLGSIIINQSK